MKPSLMNGLTRGVFLEQTLSVLEENLVRKNSEGCTDSEMLQTLHSDVLVYSRQLKDDDMVYFFVHDMQVLNTMYPNHSTSILRKLVIPARQGLCIRISSKRRNLRSFCTKLLHSPSPSCCLIL